MTLASRGSRGSGGSVGGYLGSASEQLGCSESDSESDSDSHSHSHSSISHSDRSLAHHLNHRPSRCATPPSLNHSKSPSNFFPPSDHPPPRHPSSPPRKPLPFRSINSTLPHHSITHPPSQKLAVISESLLILLALALAIYRLVSLQFHLEIIHRFIPLVPLILLSSALLLIALARHSHELSTNRPCSFRLSFTDHRGYRDPSLADDGLLIGLGIPLIVSSALLYSSSSNLISLTRLHSKNHLQVPPNLHPSLLKSTLIHSWNLFLPRFAPSFAPVHFLHRLIHARIDLLSFLILNYWSLLIDLSLSSVAINPLHLPDSNSLRLASSTLKSLIIALSLATALKLNLLGQALSQSMSFFEAVFSVFSFQSCLYLCSRLTRRSFTLGEAIIFASTSVSLMLEIIRLTSGRIRYSNHLKHHAHHLHPHPQIDLLPKMFRLPTPIIPIQHVLIAGVFIIGFLLSPLLIWSRTLGQRPTKRSILSFNPNFSSAPSIFQSTTTTPSTTCSTSKHHKTLASTPSSITSTSATIRDENEQYYQVFLNPDHLHQSRQYRNMTRERMRKLIAMSIYASVLWIGLVVLSHWLGWLLEINGGVPPLTELNTTPPQQPNLLPKAWWERIMGPGWVGFLRYIFLVQLTHPPPTLASGSRIAWKRIIILAYWLVCLGFGIGGWTTYLVKKRKLTTQSIKRLADQGGAGGVVAAAVGGGTETTPTYSSLHLNMISSNSSSRSHPHRSSFAGLVSALNPAYITKPSPPSQTAAACRLTLHPATSLFHPLRQSHQDERLNRALLLSEHRKPPLEGSPSFCPKNSLQLPTSQLQPNHNNSGSSNSITNSLLEIQVSPTATATATATTASARKRPIIGSPLLHPTNHTTSAAAGGVGYYGYQGSHLHGTHTSNYHHQSKKEELNLRRKFFHLLAGVMFLPTLIMDSEFCSMSFSVAFTVFTFMELARYFALYPLGGGIHIFFNEFIDSKDSGPVILSHFYLLTTCAIGVWLDNGGGAFSSGGGVGLFSVAGTAKVGIEDLIGVIILAFGDSVASIVGKRYGNIRYPRSHKTVEGSLGFIGALLIVGTLLKASGWIDDFDMSKYLMVCVLGACLEGSTNQNDNLVIGLFCWGVLKLAR